MDVVEPRGKSLINLHRRYYNIPTSAYISEEMILQHWALEKNIRKELLECSPEDRWDTTCRCYTKLYGNLEWLNTLVGAKHIYTSHQLYRDLVSIIGSLQNEFMRLGQEKQI